MARELVVPWSRARMACMGSPSAGGILHQRRQKAETIEILFKSGSPRGVEPRIRKPGWTDRDAQKFHRRLGGRHVADTAEQIDELHRAILLGPGRGQITARESGDDALIDWGGEVVTAANSAN